MRRRLLFPAAVGLGAALLASCTSQDAPSPRDPGKEEKGDGAGKDGGGDGTSGGGSDGGGADGGGSDGRGSDGDAAGGGADQKFPDVVKAELTADGDQFMIAVTISSPYDTPQRYADGWRVKTPDGDVLAEHELAHDHANEQPFTRTRGPFAIPDGIDQVVVEGRDQANGYGGKTVTIDVPR